MVVRFHLSADDRLLCEEYAQQRQGPKDRHRVRNYRVGPQGDLEIHRQGVRGDFVFARAVGLPMNQLDVVGGDGGAHDYVVDVWAVSVKTISRGRRYLIIPPNQWPPHCDLFVLLEDVEPQTMEFAGWATARQVLRWVDGHGRVDLGWGPSYCVPRDTLRPAEALPFDLMA